ncbi:ClpXP adapter SpxH family protein [Oikeobacillus pervagus]|nr:ClpXP adapter SpxH family protein [Oikeobacillus pervagus]
MFIDPLCPECWALEPIIKKLQIEYGQYFRLRQILTGKLASLNISKKKHETLANFWEHTASRTGMSCDGSLWLESPISSPYIASIAIKAAELQGRRAGQRFLRKLQELLFLNKQNISNFDVLEQCANEVELDLEVFIQDINSSSAAKAFQCDLKISNEMEIDEVPSLVFFNENIEDEGIKISGIYPYEIYVKIIQEMLNDIPEPTPPPPLEHFLKYYKFVATKEVAEVYDLPCKEVEKKLKKLLLQRKVQMIPAKYGTFWKYIG